MIKNDQSEYLIMKEGIIIFLQSFLKNSIWYNVLDKTVKFFYLKY